MTPIIKEIVLTGGPCAGKSSGLAKIKEYFTQLGWIVITTPEVATLVMNMGIKPVNFGDNTYFQRGLLDINCRLEQIIWELCKNFIPDSPVLIVHDRSPIDGKAYCSDKEWRDLVPQELENQLISNYDGIFYLTTAPEEYYTLENNSARQESYQEALAADARLQKVWTGSKVMIIGNEAHGSFDKKIQKVIRAICTRLGIPKPMEIERKYLILEAKERFLDFLGVGHKLSSLGIHFHKLFIEQSYLAAESETRIRKTSSPTQTFFSLTKKIETGDLIAREEKETLISEKEYLELDAGVKLGKKIRKVRFVFIQNEQQFELDVFDDGLVLLEAELADKETIPIIPDWIGPVQEVTNDPKYRNCNLANS